MRRCNDMPPSWILDSDRQSEMFGFPLQSSYGGKKDKPTQWWNLNVFENPYGLNRILIIYLIFQLLSTPLLNFCCRCNRKPTILFLVLTKQHKLSTIDNWECAWKVWCLIQISRAKALKFHHCLGFFVRPKRRINSEVGIQTLQTIGHRPKIKMAACQYTSPHPSPQTSFQRFFLS